jgi:signal transduction histidine kinase/CheY-like chemotaxis protein
VKLDLTKLSTAWAAARERVGVVDQAGMIFLSSVKEWEFTPLTPLSQADIERILAEKQYKSEHISKASILQTGTDLQSDVYLEVQGNTVLLRFMEIPEFGWRIFSAYDVGPINQFAYLAAATVFLCAALLFVLAFYLVERRQRSRANQMREILENVNAGIAVFDSDLHLLSWNNKYLQLNSYPESLILPGRALSEIINYNILKGDFGPGDPKALLQQRLDRIRKHAIRKTEVRRSDGTWLEIVRSRVPNGTLITTYTDVTERKVQAERLDAQVKERTAELHKTIEEVSVARRIAEQASLAKTSFMDSIVHEIKNPLNAILGYANLLLSGAKDKLPEKQYQNLQKLYASGWELNELADDFLEYSRADQVTVSEFALAQLIDKCLRNLEPRIHDRRIQVECDVPEDLPRLNQDERKLRSVVNNLLSNAEKYTEAGSIKVTVRRRSDLVEISVTDTGVGIADEYRQLIFDEYKRIPSSDGRTRPGTGLGLAICRRFATLMGGAIDLKSSSLGSGSTFIVSIPMIHPQTTRAAAKVASALPLTTTNESQGTGLNDERPTILIVDDSQENRDILAQLLGGAHRILLAEDGSKAIQLADLEHPDLIFMDLSLPIVSGWEATRTIKRKSQIPIIAVTAHTSEQDRNDARAAGCDDVLPKPIDQFAIHDALRRFLRPSHGNRR